MAEIMSSGFSNAFAELSRHDFMSTERDDDDVATDEEYEQAMTAKDQSYKDAVVAQAGGHTAAITQQQQAHRAAVEKQQKEFEVVVNDPTGTSLFKPADGVKVVHLGADVDEDDD